MRRLGKLLALSWRERALLVEAAVLLGVARGAVAVIPFRHIAPWLAARDAASVDGASATANQIGWALAVCGQHLPWNSSCLVRAIAGKLMLDRRGIPATVVLGVRRPGDGAFAAHAWLRAGDTIISGGRGVDDYAELARFA